MSCRPCETSPRRAVTLLEVLLVLALLVVLAAVAWPALEPVLASVELRKSAERIRVEWNRARVEALSTGCTVLFHYEPEGRRFRVEHQPDPEFFPGGSGGSDFLDQPDHSAGRESTLPERITFVGGEISGGAVEEATASVAQAGGQWSEPVAFFTDGSTSNARLVLANERGQSIEVRLRGLTGIVTVGEVFSDAEAMR